MLLLLAFSLFFVSILVSSVFSPENSLNSNTSLSKSKKLLRSIDLFESKLISLFFWLIFLVVVSEEVCVIVVLFKSSVGLFSINVYVVVVPFFSSIIVLIVVFCNT